MNAKADRVVPTIEEYRVKVQAWADDGIPRTVLTDGEVYSLAYLLQREAERVVNVCGPVIDELQRKLRATSASPTKG